MLKWLAKALPDPSYGRTLRLKTNMRVQQAQAQAQDASVLRYFANYLLRIGDGRKPTVVNDMVRFSLRW